MGWRLYKEFVDGAEPQGIVDYRLGYEGTGSRLGYGVIGGFIAETPEMLASEVNDRGQKLPESLIKIARKESKNGVVRGNGKPGPFSESELRDFLEVLNPELIILSDNSEI